MPDIPTTNRASHTETQGEKVAGNTISAEQKKRALDNVLRNQVSDAHTFLTTENIQGSISGSDKSAGEYVTHLNTQIEILDKLAREIKNCETLVEQRKAELTKIGNENAKYRAALEKYKAALEQKADSGILRERNTKMLDLHSKIQRDYENYGISTQERKLDQKYRELDENGKQIRNSLPMLKEKIESTKSSILQDFKGSTAEVWQKLNSDKQYQTMIKDRTRLNEELHNTMLDQSALAKEYTELGKRKKEIRDNYKAEAASLCQFRLHDLLTQHNQCQRYLALVEEHKMKLQQDIQSIERISPVDAASMEKRLAQHTGDGQTRSIATGAEARNLLDRAQNTNKDLISLKGTYHEQYKNIEKMASDFAIIAEQFRDSFSNESLFYPVELAKPVEHKPEIDTKLESSCTIYAARAIMQDIGRDIYHDYTESKVGDLFNLNKARARTLRRETIYGTNKMDISQGYKKMDLEAELRNGPMSHEQVERETKDGKYIHAHLVAEVDRQAYGHAVSIKGITTDGKTGQTSYIIADVMTRKTGSWIAVPAHYIDISMTGYHIVSPKSDQRGDPGNPIA